MKQVVLWAGPSTVGVPPALLRQAGLELRPPARRGDIQACVDAAERPAVMVLCDGLFQGVPAVSHAELCTALDRGWQVWGVSSMGAIRAHELRAEGMRGYGWVYAQFARHEDYTDDEMCLLHLPAPGYEPLTEALVNVRYALELQGPALGIGPAAAQRAVRALQRLWFGDRSPARVQQALVDEAGVAPETAERFMQRLAAQRIKSLDLQGLLQERPWAARRRRQP